MKPTRREVLYGGLAAVAWGLGLRRRFPAPPVRPCAPGGGLPLDATAPVLAIPATLESQMLDGLPFAPWFTGDDFRRPADYPFHNEPPCCRFAEPPAPTEEIDVAIVGGGLSGLTSAYLLRRHRPVVFELHDRFGGNARGERWLETAYSLGSAYVITPDPGSFLNSFYRQLGLHRVRREAAPLDPVELGGAIHDDFWSGAGRPPQERLAFERYAEVVRYMACDSYPEIPLPEDQDNQWIIDLDESTLRQDIEERMGMPMPPLLAAAVQAYCYSSFGAGFDEISAAAGWNFLAAEEFGRWVFPGGNSYIAQSLWEALTRLDERMPPECRPYHLRGRCMVVDVRLAARQRVQVTYVDAGGGLRSLLARYVVLACPKHVARHMLPGLESIDPRKSAAMGQSFTRAYVVANVLLDAPIARDFYDLFLIGDESFPMDGAAFAADSRVVDVLSGHFARPRPAPRSVLTLYWPLPFEAGRFTLIVGGAWDDYAARLAPQVRRMLDLLAVPHRAVRQIRLSRWGHALPIPQPGFMARGIYDDLRRPIADRIFFVNQDNWLLPAVENSLLDAESVAREIERRL